MDGRNDLRRSINCMAYSVLDDCLNRHHCISMGNERNVGTDKGKMIEVQQQVKSKILAETREKLANDLIKQAARIESLKHGNYSWINEFYGDNKGKAGFLEIFKDIVPRTSHEAAISEAKWGSISLLNAIDSYFHDPKKNIDTGILLAREYYKILITSGVIHDHE